MTFNYIRWWCSSYRALRSVEYSFTVITSRSTDLELEYLLIPYLLIKGIFENCIWSDCVQKVKLLNYTKNLNMKMQLM